MGKVEVRYRWRYYDEARRRWVNTSYWTSEERIRIEHPDAEPIEGTRQERVLLDNPMDAAPCIYMGPNGVSHRGSE